MAICFKKHVSFLFVRAILESNPSRDINHLLLFVIIYKLTGKTNSESKKKWN